MRAKIASPQQRTFNLLGILGGLGITGLLMASAWGNWRHVAFLAAMMVVVGGLNVLIGATLLPRIGSPATEWWRALLNLVASLINAQLLGWPLASWLYIPFVCILVDGQNQRTARWRILVNLAIWNGFAVVGGVSSPVVMIGFTGIGVFCYVVAASRVSLIEDMLDERVRQNAALEEAHEALKGMHIRAIAQEKLAGLGRLAAGIAHEINNPMSYVTANLNGLLEDLKAAGELTPELIEQRDEVIPGALDGVRRVNSIVSDLRRFASNERENAVRFDLRQEIDAATRIVRPLLRPQQTIRVDFPASLGMVGMPRQIGQVILNLLVNSAQALAEVGEVVVRGRLRGANVSIAISDNGSGMGKETLKNLFQPFFTTKEVGEGTGLGLSVVHGIVQAHGGTIDVDSELGRGSSFTVTLPLLA